MTARASLDECPSEMTSSDMTESIVGEVDPEVTVTYKWTVSASCLGGKKTGERLISPVIAFNDTMHCRIWLYPKSDAKEFENYISIYLDSVKNDFKARVRFYLLNNMGQIVNPMRLKKSQFKANGSPVGFQRFGENKLLEDAMTLVQVDGNLTRALTVVCELVIDKSVEGGLFSNLDHEARLREFDDFEKLVDNDELSDVMIIINERILHAHKGILALKSEVFAAMFTHSNKEENEEAFVKVDDVSCNVMKELLRFMYAGKVRNLDRRAKELLVVADKYSVQGLKIMTENHLVQRIDSHNVLQYLQLSTLCDASTLRSGCISFLKSNVTEVVNHFSSKMSDWDKGIIDEIFPMVFDPVRNLSLNPVKNDDPLPTLLFDGDKKKGIVREIATEGNGEFE